MSVWSEIFGTVTVKVGSGCSVRDCIVAAFGDELYIRYLTQKFIGKEKLSVSLSITFCSDGLPAAIQVKDFIQKIKSYDKTAEIDITSEIRFLN